MKSGINFCCCRCWCFVVVFRNYILYSFSRSNTSDITGTKIQSLKNVGFFSIQSLIKSYFCSFPEKPLVEKQLSSSTAGGFNLSWAEQVTATCGYTVEWCSQGNAILCTLQWIKIPQRNNTLFLPAGEFLLCCFPLVVMHYSNLSVFNFFCRKFQSRL